MTHVAATSTNRRSITIAAAGVTLHGDLVLFPGSRGLVVFAHGSGSSRLSPRNQRVAGWLHQGGFGTLLFDLLTPAEEVIDAETAHLRFDIEFLSRRLVAVTDWLSSTPDTRQLPLGYFGASTGAAAALVAAAMRPQLIRAVVSRGGRPDLAGSFLAQVRAPTLLIVGGEDTTVIGLNQEALALMQVSPRQLVIVPGATHLFEEPGAMEQVAELAQDWFHRHLAAAPVAPAGA